jgi:hypothetical protein
MHAFTDAQTAEALAHIIRSKPRIVAVDHEFSATSGGAALINRIKDDPALLACELRVIQHDDLGALAASATGTAGASDEPRPPLDRPCVRRERRREMPKGIELLVDGYTAGIVDLSPLGAQVLSPRSLKPNQRVRVVFSDDTGIVRCQGSIVWAAFEMPAGEPPRYRAGIALAPGDPDALRSYLERHVGKDRPKK